MYPIASILTSATLSHNIFQSLFIDNLIMGNIEIPLESCNEKVNQKNHRIFHLQNERKSLIETILYQDSVDKLLQEWQNIIKKIALKAVPKKKGTQWLSSWNSYLEFCLNNYQYLKI